MDYGGSAVTGSGFAQASDFSFWILPGIGNAFLGVNVDPTGGAHVRFCAALTTGELETDRGSFPCPWSVVFLYLGRLFFSYPWKLSCPFPENFVLPCLQKFLFPFLLKLAFRYRGLRKELATHRTVPL